MVSLSWLSFPDPPGRLDADANVDLDVDVVVDTETDAIVLALALVLVEEEPLLLLVLLVLLLLLSVDRDDANVLAVLDRLVPLVLDKLVPLLPRPNTSAKLARGLSLGVAVERQCECAVSRMDRTDPVVPVVRPAVLLVVVCTVLLDFGISLISLANDLGLSEALSVVIIVLVSDAGNERLSEDDVVVVAVTGGDGKYSAVAPAPLAE